MSFVQLLEWVENHARLFTVLSAVTAILSFVFGFLWGRISTFRERRRQWHEYRKMENPGVAVFEAHVLKEKENGFISLHVISWGGKHALEDILHDAVLEQKVEKIARARKGFLYLDPPGQLLVMDGLEELITGNDSSANLDTIKGRPSQNDRVIMCPVTWPGLRAAHLIRVVIIDSDWMERLCDREVIDRIRATRSRYQYRSEWLHLIAKRWLEEKDKSEEEACMRLVEIESQRLE